MNIKIIHALSVFLFVSVGISAQETERYELGFADVFVLKVRIDEPVLKGKSTCVYKKGTSCSLYKINVVRVLYCPLNSVFDSVKLTQIKYLLLPDKKADSFVQGKEFLITTMSTTSETYLALTKILDTKLEKNYLFWHRHAYLSGLIKCKSRRRDLFEEYINASIVK